MDEFNRKNLLIISFLREFISVFFYLFFNIYIYQAVNDFGLIIKYNLVGVIFEFIFCYIVMKFITNKNAKFIYNSSFIQLIICIFLLIIFKENVVNFIYLFRILYSLQQSCYYQPKEIAVIGANNHKTVSNFSANSLILKSLATILTPIFSGFIIDTFSYNVLFVILSIEAFLTIIISSRLKSFYIEEKKLDIKGFLQKAKSYPHLKDSYLCMLYRRISSQGAILTLLPIILFLRVGTELSVGAYNSLFALLSIICLLVLKNFNKKGIKKRFYTPFSIIIFISSVILVFDSNLTTLIIYYVLINTLGAIIESDSGSMIFETVKIDDLSVYKREHEVVFNFFMLIGQVISYVIAYVLYTYFCNANILSLAISIMMFFLIISCLYLTKVESFFEKIR